MIARYTNPEMGRIWSEQRRYECWLQVELAAAEAMAAAGIVPAEAARELRDKGAFNIARIEEIEKTTQHDVIAFTTSVAEIVGPSARWLHFGLTSSDVVDTAQALQMVEACDLILANMTALAGAMRRVVQEADRNLPVSNVRTMQEIVEQSVVTRRFPMLLMGLFAGLALLLSAVGLYGVIAYSVTQRTREIGVRMALGADGGRVQRMVLRQVGVMVAIGTVIGAVGAFMVGRAAQSLLFGLQGHDAQVFVGAVVLLAAVAFGAGWLPARRASRTQPMMALRYN